MVHYRIVPKGDVLVAARAFKWQVAKVSFSIEAGILELSNVHKVDIPADLKLFDGLEGGYGVHDVFCTSVMEGFAEGQGAGGQICWTMYLLSRLVPSAHPVHSDMNNVLPD